MDASKATLAEYRSFIADPQRCGVWSLRLELSEKDISSLIEALNLQNDLSYLRRRWHSYRFRTYSGSRESVDNRLPIIIPRLFAYLRVTIPKKERDGLPGLSLTKRTTNVRMRRFPVSRAFLFLENLLTLPPRLGTAKKEVLSRAAALYKEHFVHCRIALVPENPSKADFISTDPLVYFQVMEELPICIRFLSPCESTLNALQHLLEALSGRNFAAELTKVFSPENTLMEMYLPMLQLTRLTEVLKDRTAARNVKQALEEADEERFIHAIRAVGIATEELLVEIYETYLREKAPEAPLGNLINELQTRLQEIVLGAKSIRDNPLAGSRKQIGKLIEEEKKKRRPNKSLIELAEQLQKNVIPSLDSIKAIIDDNLTITAKTQKIALFPSYVQRCLSELVILRNRVSHRVERGTSVASVGYVDTAVALRDFLVVAKWWENERTSINYKASRKTIIQETVKRSKIAESEPEAEV